MVRAFTTLDISPDEFFTQQMARLEEAEAFMRQLAGCSFSGHHLEASLGRETEMHPAVRFRPQPVFGEGWAAYAEQLAFEQGMHSTDAAGLVAIARVSERFAGNVGELGCTSRAGRASRPSTSGSNTASWSPSSRPNR